MTICIFFTGKFITNVREIKKYSELKLEKWNENYTIKYIHLLIKNNKKNKIITQSNDIKMF